MIPEEHIIESLLSDSQKADYSQLPETGLPLETEHVLSPIFVYRDVPPYGTRSMAVVAVLKTGEATFYEKYIEDGVWKDHKLSFAIPTTTTKKVETDDKLQSADKSLEWNKKLPECNSALVWVSFEVADDMNLNLG